MNVAKIITCIAVLVTLLFMVLIVLKLKSKKDKTKAPLKKSRNRAGPSPPSPNSGPSYGPISNSSLPACRSHYVDKNNTVVSNCVDTAGYNDFGCQCCPYDRDSGNPLVPFAGFGGSLYCLGQGSQNRTTACQEACMDDNNQLVPDCYKACLDIGSVINKPISKDQLCKYNCTKPDGTINADCYNDCIK